MLFYTHTQEHDGECDLSSLEVGHLVALFTEQLSDAPWIGKVDKIEEETVDVTWLDGGYRKPWKVATRREGRKVVQWKDTVSKDSIILFAFQLTKANRLSAEAVRNLQKIYSDMCKQ